MMRLGNAKRAKIAHILAYVSVRACVISLCDNDFPIGYEPASAIPAGGGFPKFNGKTDCSMTQQMQKLIGALLLIALLLTVTYISFRAYLGPDFLIGFANLFVC